MNNSKYLNNCLKLPNIMFPKPGIDLEKWAVIACDQFTSEPEYWQQVAKIVGDAPSTYHMVLPEVYLDTPDEKTLIHRTTQAMHNYLQSDIFMEVNSPIYVRRTVDGFTRSGLMVCVDLEHYDYTKGSQTLIRATEGTIVDRLPPRIRIRKDAPLEIPHILVLFDDPHNTVLGPLEEYTKGQNPLYDFDLMLESGHLTGYEISAQTLQLKTFDSLEALIDPETFANKYNLPLGRYEPLLFAMGDGNHSLATAKAVWDEIKPSVDIDHPARYALVEIENIHDPALSFEPIHRLLFNLSVDIFAQMRAYWGERLSIHDVAAAEEMIEIIDSSTKADHKFGLVSSAGFKVLTIHEPTHNLPVGDLQDFLDIFLNNGFAEKLDYVHGTQVLFEKGQIQNNVGFFLPGIEKSDLFKTVILDGALPRKTFSMGEAKSKRFYLESRCIKPA